MGFLDKFLDAMKLNDDDYDDDDFLDDEEFDDDIEEEKPKRRFFKKSNDDDFDDFDDFDKKPSKETKETKKTASSTAFKKSSSKVTPMRKKGPAAMEVNVIRPESMEDAREIAETLMNNCTVILNLEGLDVDIAQRIIDFTCGACYSLAGQLQKISGYIYILTPSGVDISGDSQEILNGAIDMSSLR